MTVLIILLVVIILIMMFGYFWYVALIRRRNRVQEALSSIDVQLRKRHDLLPNVLKMANQFMTHERELLNRVTELRTQAQKPYDPEDKEQVQKHLDAEGALQAGMRRMFAVAENYPELRSSETIVETQQTFRDVEGHIAASRRFYNAAVTDLNTSVQIFPGSMIAGMAGVQEMPFFEIEDEAMRQPVDADAFLNVPGAPAKGDARA
ncbi:MAG: LemA family protein [Paracoccaceae bacterium]